MKYWLRQYSAMTGNAFVVLLGDPFTFILHLGLLIATGLIACLPTFSFGEHLRLLRDQTLALTFIGCAVAATLGTARTIGDEMKKGMAPLIMSRPVSPAAFLCGKWTGICGVLALMVASSTAAYLWGSRIVFHPHHLETLALAVYSIGIASILIIMSLHHYLRGGSFVRHANIALTLTVIVLLLITGFFGYNSAPQPHYGALVDWPSSLAYLYLLLGLIAYTALLSAFAVNSELSMLMAISAIIFFVGLLSEYVIWQFLPGESIPRIFRMLLPNWQIFWVSEHIADFGMPPSSYLLACLTHTLGQSFIYLGIGIIWFRRQEITGTV